ncbi:hypothetical protein [Chryseobacterium sp. Leaf405]|uniref:hypothetical protein n=1 Tax=Chryseobacterium sp. Leaf405 TaxID=1736367 RepID=UPI00103BDF06|nr:hypothetical protein [Chryseobacterium sp. Leaf405]
MINMLNIFPQSKITKQLVFLLALLLRTCNGNGSQQTEKKSGDTIGANLKVEPVKNKKIARQKHRKHCGKDSSWENRRWQIEPKLIISIISLMRSVYRRLQFKIRSY